MNKLAPLSDAGFLQTMRYTPTERKPALSRQGSPYPLRDQTRSRNGSVVDQTQTVSHHQEESVVSPSRTSQVSLSQTGEVSQSRTGEVPQSRTGEVSQSRTGEVHQSGMGEVSRSRTSQVSQSRISHRSLSQTSQVSLTPETDILETSQIELENLDDTTPRVSGTWVPAASTTTSEVGISPAESEPAPDLLVEAAKQVEETAGRHDSRMTHST